MPVLASGDLMSAAAGQRVLAHTGATGVMYARGALADPRIFAHHAALFPGAAALPRPLPPVCEVIRRHAALCREYADDRQALLRMRTAVPRYLRDLPGCRALRARLCRVDSWEELGQIINEAEGLCNAPPRTVGETS